MRSWKMFCLLFAALLASACSDVVAFESESAPAPDGDPPSSKIALRWIDWDDAEPEPGSQETFAFVVELSNVGQKPYEWPDPCPTYRWSWGESATEYGSGYGYLNCADVPELQPGEAQEFLIETPAADTSGASTLGWQLVDPRSCNFMTMTFDQGEASNPGPTSEDLGCAAAY